MRKSQFKIVGILFVLVLGLSSIAAAEVVTISMLTSDQEQAETLVAAFEAKHPNIRIEVESADPDYEKMSILVASGIEPDLLQIGEAYVTPWVQRGVLRSLDEFIEKDPSFPIDDFFPTIIDPFRYEGKLYVIPKDFVVHAALYNTNMFASAGLTTPTEGWTLDDYLNAAQLLTRRSGDDTSVWGTFVRTYWGLYLPYIWMNGGEYIRDRQVFIDQPAATDGIQWWADLIHVSEVAPPPGTPASFGNGQVAIELNGSFVVPGLKMNDSLSWAAAPIPAGPNGAYSSLFSTGWGISSRSEHPDAAFAFLKWLAEEGSLLITDSGFALPPRQQLALQAELFHGGGDHNLGAFLHSVSVARHPEVSSSWPEQIQVIDSHLGPVWRGEQPASTALSQAAEQIRQLLAEEPAH